MTLHRQLRRAPGPNDLSERRLQLVLRSAQLRARLVQGSGVLQPALRLNDRLRDGAQALKQYQGLGLLGAALVLGLGLMRPRLVLGLGLRAWSGWRLWRRVQPVALGVWRQLMR